MTLRSLFAVLGIVLLPHLPAASAAPEAPAGASRSIPFTNLGVRTALELRGAGSSATIDFGTRADELVTKATFHIRYAYSPALATTPAHIRLTFNDEAVGLLPVSAESAGETVAHDVEVDPRLFIGFNKLVVSVVAQRALSPQEAAQPGLWVEISSTSTLEVSTRPLVPADDLALLPEPFFDRRDSRRVTIPFVFARQPSRPALRAAAVAASWLGSLATWRGARFPARLDEPAPGHAIAFATNTERPEFLAQLPPATGPQLRIMTNPADGASKLLLVLGRDGNDLKAAADALVLGAGAMSGASVQVKEAPVKAPRPAYDAPRWVRLDAPVKLGSLIDWPGQLQATGRPPALDPVKVDVRIPPDLAAWRGPGVPMTLKVRYTPPVCAGEGHLDVSVNGELLKTLGLRVVARGGEAAKAAKPALPETMVDTTDLFISAFRLRSRTQLQFAFHFSMRKDGECRDVQPDSVRAAVEPDSTIDFSGFPHYTVLPHLGHFANMGFPFTKYADLGQTVVVLPERPGAQEIEALLTLMGRMGESTGYPATGVRIAAGTEQESLRDADILVIEAAAHQGLLGQWGASLPVAVSTSVRRVSQPARGVHAVYEWLGFGNAPDPAVASQVKFEGDGPLAAILGFESPLTPGRSVVAVTAVVPDQTLRVLDALEDSDDRREMGGSAVLIHPRKVEGLLVGPTYETGSLPPWTGAWYWLFERPVVLGALAAAALAILGFAAWGVRAALGARRARRSA